MLHHPDWRWIPESEQLALDLPDRQLTIRWDDEDRGWFLSVIKPPRPATMGQPAREAEVYICPLPLLAALVLVPPAFHGHLRDRVRRELERSRGAVHTSLGVAVGQIMRTWPDQARAADELARAVGHAQSVERLGLDWAAAGAMED